MAKKLFWIVGILVGLFVVAAIAAPFMINVDKFRPQIVQAVNEHINGDFKLGKLQLSLWSGVKVKIESLSIQAKDESKPMLDTRSAYLKIPLLSLIRMHPSVVVVISQPNVSIIKEKDGKMNLMSLVKSSAPVQTQTSSSKSSGLPSIAANASLSLRIENGVVSYYDETSGTRMALNGVDLDVQNLGLAGTIDMNLKLPMKARVAGQTIAATISTNAQIKPDFANGQIQGVSGAFAVAIDELALKGTAAVALEPKMSVNLDLSSSQLNMADLQKVLPMLKAYHLSGMTSLHVKVDGPVDDLAIKEDLHVKAPGLVANLKGEIQNLTAPHFNFALEASEVNADKFLMLAPAQAQKGKTASSSAPTQAENPMRKLAQNPMLAKAVGTVSAHIAKLTAKGALISDLTAHATLKDLVLNLESLSLKTFEGSLNTNFTADLKSPQLRFSTVGQLNGLQSQSAIATFVPKFKNTLSGKVNANWKMAGSVFPQSELMRSLNGAVNLAAQNGQLRSIDLNGSIKGVLSRVSFLKGVNPPEIDEGFKTLRVSMKFANGLIDANPFEMIGNEKGLNIKGHSQIQPDLTQDTYVDIYDPNHLLPQAISNGKDAVMQLHVTGQLSSPSTDYAYTVSRLAKVVVRNEGKKAIVNGLQKLMGNALGGKGGSSAGKAASGLLGNALKGLGF